MEAEIKGMELLSTSGVVSMAGTKKTLKTNQPNTLKHVLLFNSPPEISLSGVLDFKHEVLGFLTSLVAFHIQMTAEDGAEDFFSCFHPLGRINLEKTELRRSGEGGRSLMLALNGNCCIRCSPGPLQFPR